MLPARSVESAGVSRRWRAAMVLLLATGGTFAAIVAVLSFFLSLAVPKPGKSDWSQRGVGLGMTEAQVRRSFVDASAGEWRRSTACGGPSIEWTRSKPGVPTRWARFELHDGWVVAMRLHSDGQAAGSRSEVRSFAVRRDRPFQGGLATTIIARGPAAYAVEVDQIVRSAASSLSNADRRAQ
jgi:hypothetical protein